MSLVSVFENVKVISENVSLTNHKHDDNKGGNSEVNFGM